MAKSDANEMRIQRVEQAIVQLTTLHVELGERVDGGFNRLHAELHGLRGEMRGEVHAVRGELLTLREALTDRLDRLISVTVKARTEDIERFEDIERRLARLEERVGV
jgi:hypothetical protein